MSKLRIDLIGQKFSKLTVIKYAGRNKGKDFRWLCLWDCGKEKIVQGGHLKSGHTKSCGCWRKEIIATIMTKHGFSGDKIYNIWKGMIRRCTNQNDKSYHSYGGRGITVCKRWLKFKNFLEDMGEAPSGRQIDRINNNGNYCKSNCRWVTQKQQQRNTRRNHLITCFGKTQCAAAWAEETGISTKIILKRLKASWSPEKALTTPPRR